VRCLLLPAVLHLLGERTWWLPGWLDRILPRVNVEGTTTIEPEPALAPNGAVNGEVRAGRREGVGARGS
jgi:RND superfamily putative drug exporter